jgi:XTP/dITP diphosphohydrolase
MTPSRDIARLIDIMAALRTPGTGCPWDLEQNFATIAPYTIEEAYEVADAIVRGDLDDLRDELGDLLLQVVFHARMAQEQGAFDFGDVVQALTEKLVRRHPHVFGDGDATTPAEVEQAWEVIKAQERAAAAGDSGHPGGEAGHAGLLHGIPRSLPSLLAAEKVLARWERTGGDLAALGGAAGGDDADLGVAMLALVARARQRGESAETLLRAALSSVGTEPGS